MEEESPHEPVLRAAQDHGIRSQAGLRLFDNGQSQGALNPYSTRVGAVCTRCRLRGIAAATRGSRMMNRPRCRTAPPIVEAHAPCPSGAI